MRFLFFMLHFFVRIFKLCVDVSLMSLAHEVKYHGHFVENVSTTLRQIENIRLYKTMHDYSIKTRFDQGYLEIL